jgi:hypothetical protein
MFKGVKIIQQQEKRCERVSGSSDRHLRLRDEKKCFGLVNSYYAFGTLNNYGSGAYLAIFLAIEKKIFGEKATGR